MFSVQYILELIAFSTEKCSDEQFYLTDCYFSSIHLADSFCKQKHPKRKLFCIFPPQDGVMVPYTKELGDKMKHGLKQVGRKYIFSMRDLMPDDAGLYQLDVEDVNMFSTEFKSTFSRQHFQCITKNTNNTMNKSNSVFICFIFQSLWWIFW